MVLSCQEDLWEFLTDGEAFDENEWYPLDDIRKYFGDLVTDRDHHFSSVEAFNHVLLEEGAMKRGFGVISDDLTGQWKLGSRVKFPKIKP
jgi:hypothetical protein